MDLTNEDVADILALLDSLPYDALDLRTDRFHLTLRRGANGGWTEESELLSQPVDVTPEQPSGSADAGGVAGPGEGKAVPAAVEDEAGTASRRDGLIAVAAPLPGTFYRAPRPGAPPFVEVGDVVGPDTVVAIIETMKLMNSVHAGTPGRVTRILPANGDLVPLGAALLLIDPDSPTPSDPPS
ncbi:MAG TPA: biotin/lipoyl-containing protein [Trebonia sp.]|nr:biotin/lipoyl-containing protein [Trebonia sp.]